MLITATIAGRKRIDIVFLLLVVFLSISSLGYLRHRSKLHSIKKRLFSIIFENKSASPKEIAKKEYIDKGCVLVANSDEYDRFMSKAVIFLIAHGDRGSQGLIVNKVWNYLPNKYLNN